MASSLFVLGLGVAGLILGWSFRPPSDLGDALMMAGQGRDFFLKEPVFLGLMAVSGVIALIGASMLVKRLNSK